MDGHSIKFGYYPRPLSVTTSTISIETLAGLEETVSVVERCDGVDGDWIHAPLQETFSFGGVVTTKPFQTRVFGMPKTHALRHTSSTDPQHLDFLVWGISFFLGMRLTTAEAGFVDATPLKPGRLVDFVFGGNGDMTAALDLLEEFWQRSADHSLQRKQFVGAVHALFLAQSPRNLQFESFMFLYAALDACYALAKDIEPPSRRISHAERTAWLCERWNVPVPYWAAVGADHASPLSELRNMTMHEALYVGEPLGFAIHGLESGENLPLELEALVCRLLVALVGAPNAAYVRTPIDSRQRLMLRLS